MSGTVAGYLVCFLQLLFFLLAGCYLGVAVFSLFPVRYRTVPEPRNLRFAVVIPAHNEAVPLKFLMDSLRRQDYPPDHIRIFVVADCCTDDTARLACRMGAQVLMHSEDQGKGAALKMAFAHILESPDAFDAVAVLDADNLADPRFFAELNLAMQQGAEAVQGYVDAKNPNDSWMANAYAIWYWITNRVSQMGFSRLGAGCRLNGTGFAISLALLRQVPWDTRTLAEDCEYTVQLALAGKKVFYTPAAVVYDEKPNSFRASVMQRRRWAQGITAVQRDYAGQMLRSGRWMALLRFWSDLLMPLCFFLFLVLDGFAVSNLAGFTTVRFAGLWMKPLNLTLLNLYLAGTVITVGIGLVLDKKCSRKLPLNILGLLLFLLSWIPAGLSGVLHHTKKEWYHTEHKRTM